ncbi:hypothetical protein [Actinoallomurus rhizosphaericola]|uniref:hypothetical protein n=1 Tax=Actinoallomurus rhizosphaericola TaxID=2952536 RepID=UPI002091F438|nr:hypothetical protein [Actinoallomurus rhizosphaericola]MCO5999310.1 hypothetical protein [Actinoallomurus rhizosphaericola]
MPGDRARTHIPPPREIWPSSELFREVGRLVAEELERPASHVRRRDPENPGGEQNPDRA